MTGTEKRVLTVFLGIFFAAFIILSYMISTGYTQLADERIANWFYQIRGEKGGTVYLIFRLITEFGYVYVLVFLIIIMAVRWRLDIKTFSLGFGCLIIYTTNEIVKLFFQRQRPDIVMQWMHESSTSFPSGHSMTSFFAYGILLFFGLHSKTLKKRGKTILSCATVLIILLIGISRMVLGMHYFTDIIGGYLLGYVGLVIVLYLYDYLYAIGFEFLKPYLARRKKKTKRD